MLENQPAEKGSGNAFHEYITSTDAVKDSPAAPARMPKQVNPIRGAVRLKIIGLYA